MGAGREKETRGALSVNGRFLFSMKFWLIRSFSGLTCCQCNRCNGRIKYTAYRDETGSINTTEGICKFKTEGGIMYDVRCVIYGK